MARHDKVGRIAWAGGFLAACLVVLRLAAFAGPVAQDEEKLGGWGGANLRVQMNGENDELLNGRLGPALLRTLAGRRFVP